MRRDEELTQGRHSQLQLAPPDPLQDTEEPIRHRCPCDQVTQRERRTKGNEKQQRESRSEEEQVHLKELQPMGSPGSNKYLLRDCGLEGESTSKHRKSERGKEQEREITKHSDHNCPPAALGDHVQESGEEKGGERKERDGRIYLCLSLCLTARFYFKWQ